MMPNKSIYRDADAAEINLYELNFARFFSIQTSENGWRRVVCELVRRAAKGTKELRLEDGTELPGEKTFPDYVVDLMDSYLAVLPDAKPHAYPAAEREQLMERHCRHTEDGGIDYDYYQDMTLDTFIFNMRNVGAAFAVSLAQNLRPSLYWSTCMTASATPSPTCSLTAVRMISRPIAISRFWRPALP